MPAFEPRYNIAPMTSIVVIRDGEEVRTGSLMRWGFSFWAKDTKRKPSLLHNARSETIFEKTLFMASFRRQRCLIPASGFYEWQRQSDGRKQPFFISSKDGSPLSFAGIWDSTTTGDGEKIDSCAILTTCCNALIKPIHARMPVIVATECWNIWLDPLPQPDEVLLTILKPSDPNQMRVWPVSQAVRRAANQGEELIQPVNA